MEALGLSLGMVIVLAVLFVYLGLNRPVENAALMADKEMRKLLSEQTKRHDEWYINNILDEASVEKADKSREYYEKRMRS
jgi:hypothetical protein